MKIVLTGVNHRTAPVELRERLAIAPLELEEATRRLCCTPGIREGLILSTCNRVEIVAGQDTSAGPGDAGLLNFIEAYFNIDREILRPHLYEFDGEEAVRHLYRVASSLDSMVVGEPQILGQVKDAYLAARSAGAMNGHLDQVLQRALTVAKRVRRETRIGSHSVSIASVAVDLAEKIFGSLKDKNVLLVGAGQMSELAARHLVEQGAGAVFVANRTERHAEALARQFKGIAVRFENLERTAEQADIIITSTGAPQAIFRKEHGQRFLQRRRGRPMFFIDIAVPRDVDPELNELEGIFLYDIDDLQSVASSNMKERVKEAELAESIVAAEVEQYRQRLRTLNIIPEIMRLQRLMDEIREAEVRRLEGRFGALTPDQHAAVDALTRSLACKFLHHPVRAIKAAAKEGDAAAVETIRRAFGLHLTGRYGDAEAHAALAPRPREGEAVSGEEIVEFDEDRPRG